MVSVHQDSELGKKIYEERRSRGLSRQRLSLISGYSYGTIGLLERTGKGSPFLTSVLLDALKKIPPQDKKLLSPKKFIIYVKKFYKKYHCTAYDLFPDTPQGKRQIFNFNESMRGNRLFGVELREQLIKKMDSIIAEFNAWGMKRYDYEFSLWLQKQILARGIDQKDLEKYTGLSHHRIKTALLKSKNPRYIIMEKIVSIVLSIPVIRK